MSLAMIDNSMPGTGPRLRRVLPVMTNIAAILYCGTDQATTIRNQVAKGATAPIVNGVPAYSAGHVSLSGTKSLEFTAMEEPASYTMMMVVKPTGDLSVSSGRPDFAGWFNNNVAPKGSHLSISAATGLRWQDMVSVSGTPTDRFINMTYLAGELLIERLIAISVQDGVRADVYDYTKNVQGSAVSANSRVLPTGRGLRIGANHQTTGTGSWDLSKFIYWPGVALSKAQLDQVVVPVRAYMLDVNGVTV